MGIKQLLALLNSADDDDESTAAVDPDETPEDVGRGEDPSDEPDAGEDAASGDAAAPDVDAITDAEPPGEQSVEELRDSLNRLAAENEMLRNRIAELGGDAALGITEAADEPEPDVESGDGEDDEVDEDQAQADIDERKALIAELGS